MLFADIILPLPIEGLFTYSVPDALCPMAQVGCRVLVSFGRSKKYVGLIAALHNRQPEGFQVKAIIRLIDSQPLVLDSQLRLWQWIADYYMSPIGEVYKAALPAGLKAEEGYTPKTDTFVRLTPPYRDSQAQHTAIDMLSQSRAYKQKEAFEAFLNAGADLSLIAFLNTSHASSATVRALVSRGLLETYEVEVGRLNHGGDPHPERIKTLTTAQQDAYNKILLSMMRKQVTLLHGVTSSGKTEIYIHLIQREIDAGRQVLYLLPEIALTVQMMDRLRRVFGNRLGIYHSRY